MGRIKNIILLTLLLAVPGFAMAEADVPPELQSLDPLINKKTVAEAGGEPVLLQFWASWCHSCSGIMFDMDELLEANPGVRYISVSQDETAGAAEEYIRKHALFNKYSNNYFYDAGKALADQLGVKTVPTIFVLDRNGNVLIRKSGHLNSKDKQEIAGTMKNAL